MAGISEPLSLTPWRRFDRRFRAGRPSAQPPPARHRASAAAQIADAPNARPNPAPAAAAPDHGPRTAPPKVLFRADRRRQAFGPPMVRPAAIGRDVGRPDHQDEPEGQAPARRRPPPSPAGSAGTAGRAARASTGSPARLIGARRARSSAVAPRAGRSGPGTGGMVSAARDAQARRRPHRLGHGQRGDQESEAELEATGRPRPGSPARTPAAPIPCAAR